MSMEREGKKKKKEKKESLAASQCLQHYCTCQVDIYTMPVEASRCGVCVLVRRGGGEDVKKKSNQNSYGHGCVEFNRPREGHIRVPNVRQRERKGEVGGGGGEGSGGGGGGGEEPC